MADLQHADALMTALGFDGLTPSPVPHETKAAAGGPLDHWLLEKEGLANRKNQT